MSTSDPPSDAAVPMLETAEAVSRAQDAGVPVELARLNVFRTLLHRPAPAKALSDLLLSMLFGGALDDRLRELVIMRLGWTTAADYEWTQHWAIAQERFGLTPDELLAVRSPDPAPELDDDDRAVLAAVDETLAHGAVSPETLGRCRAAVGSDEALVELVVAIGCWRTVSELTRTLDIPLEAGVTSWPPDGRAGPG